MKKAFSSNQLPVALDAMGGDFAPEKIIKGACHAARLDNVKVVLLGNELQIKQHLIKCSSLDLLDKDLISIVHCDEEIAMDEKPSQAIRLKKNSSIAIGCDLVVSGKARAVLSAGNSGAMMAFALKKFGRIKGILRPAIAAVLPTKNGRCLLIDAGANTECSPLHLVQFAIMGSSYVKSNFNIAKPKVAIISNGSEKSKGNDITREAFSLLDDSKTVNFAGYCEGNDVLLGDFQVVVCDGFAGNIVLKTAEGTAKLIAQTISQSIKKASWIHKISALLLKNHLSSLKKKFDPREYGSAPLLGLKMPAFIAHGGSDENAIRSGLRQIYQINCNLSDDISKEIKKSNLFNIA